MRLPRTISKLKAVPALVAGLAAPALVAGLAARHAGSGLSDLDATFDNPGNLRARVFIPESLAENAALVVVLHGCTQNADDYDTGSGWSQLAARHGFALLYPEQMRPNNPNLCFNWFQPRDTRRGEGEAASIHAMVEATCAGYAIDRARVFVTGLSAGGAMAGAMLATYPETFAAGAIIAGIPYGCASGVGEALECMAGRNVPADATVLGDRIRGASANTRPWPRVSVWHGSADHTVAPGNGDAIVRQWADVHHLPAAPTRTELVDGYTRSIWAGVGEKVLVEHYAIAGMGHGTPLRPGTRVGEAGEARAHMLDVGISSTDRIAAFFGVASSVADTVEKPRPKQQIKPPIALASTETAPPDLTAAKAGGPQKVIEDALRAAGLMR